MSDENRPTRLAMIASKGTLDWAYPPYILASTAAALDMEVAIFFTFYGLPLLMKDLKAKVSPHSNPAMPMKMPFGPEGFQGFTWPIPNAISGVVPGFDSFATAMMKKTFAEQGSGDDRAAARGVRRGRRPAHRLSDDHGCLWLFQRRFHRRMRDRRSGDLSWSSPPTPTSACSSRSILRAGHRSGYGPRPV